MPCFYLASILWLVGKQLTHTVSAIMRVPSFNVSKDFNFPFQLSLDFFQSTLSFHFELVRILKISNLFLPCFVTYIRDSCVNNIYSSQNPLFDILFKNSFCLSASFLNYLITLPPPISIIIFSILKHLLDHNPTH